MIGWVRRAISDWRRGREARWAEEFENLRAAQRTFYDAWHYVITDEHDAALALKTLDDEIHGGQMTDAQKDAIVAAARELMKDMPGEMLWPFPVRKMAVLRDAVRAAEQRWTAEMETVGKNRGSYAVVRDGSRFACYAASRIDAENIARLLNEDDARVAGEKR